MRSESPTLNGYRNLCSPDRGAEPRSPDLPPGGDSVPVAAEPFPQLPQPNTEPDNDQSSITPLTVPATVNGKIPLAASPSLVPQPFSAFGSLSQFKDAQRMATMLARSSIVPENYRGEAHIGDCVIALEIANRIGASILAVMQNLQHVRGRPGWSSQFLISCVNASKRFSPLRYQMTGTHGEDNWGCIAWAHDKSGELLKSPEVTIRRAKAEGWYYRPHSKWRTLPELMLRYRSATLFARLYAPDVTMGIQTTEEVVEMGTEGSGTITRPNFATEHPEQKSATNFDSKSEVEIPIESAAGASISDEATSQARSKSESKANPSVPSTPAHAVGHTAATGHYHYLKALKGLIGLSQYSDNDVLTYLRENRCCDHSLASLTEVAQQHPDVIVWTHDHWHRVEQELTQLGKGRTP